jgi:hypothetical protein
MEQNPEELEKEAWEIYAEALKKIKIPENVTISKNDDGTFSCIILFSYEGIGTTFINFKPSTNKIKHFLRITESIAGIPVDFQENFN